MLTDHVFFGQQYEVRWRCIRGAGSCYSFSDYWSTRIVNSTSSYIDVTYYGTAYEFEITVITSHGRGSPYKLAMYVPPLNGMPRDFSCQVKAYSAVLTCHWSPPTDFNPAGFYVSSSLRNDVLRYDLARPKISFRFKVKPVS